MLTRRIYRLPVFVLLLALIIAAGPIAAFGEDTASGPVVWSKHSPAVRPPIDSPGISGYVGTPTGASARAAALRAENASQRAPRSVFPPDERIRVSPAVSAIAFLESINQAETQVFECTGTFIAPDVLLTAAHCLYTEDLGGWASNIWVTPGMDGYDNFYPFGYDLAYNYWVPAAWYESFDELWDFGLIVMPNGNLGYATGWLEIGMLTTQSLLDPNFKPTIIGYPGDKAHGTQWAGQKQAFVDVTNYVLYYDIDTYSGQSGSAVLRADDAVIVGIHAHGGSQLNDANRIDQSLLDALLDGCADMDCEFAYFIEEPIVEPEPTATVPDGAAFDAVWATTDALVAGGGAGYSWFWGPTVNLDTWESYAESPNGARQVRYYDKSRMEITNPDGDSSSIWYVTNGLLTVELVTGRMQTGNSRWEQRPPAQVKVAGDPTNNPGTPTYATFANLATTDGSSNRVSNRTGQPVTQFLAGNGQVASTEDGGVTLAHYRAETGHNIASVFWSWANSANSGLRPDQGVDWLYVLGFPITEPFWIDATIGGTQQRVLVQLFERRALTYNPANPPQFRVEFGNIGLHYQLWRYSESQPRTR
ncbi:MAG: hypothetical protein DCC58_09570 [Chloroflexi bacterium]|nr:MAG: hypothetical protein DCC58_09570 [Chloroflexota bacterium]